MNKEQDYNVSISFNDELLEDICEEELGILHAMLPDLIRDTLIQIELEKE
ncbi:hypothetical protein Ga0123461_1811 [Mariprofundus aestuarium]|uniref:Uncharacterized protein n=1 Tax=Mariprofundus aestuarium TaxID=1921086 RepID=A0A2K8L5F1_MARES|nr:hypothetical protein [Mariprofundus aestuarium]ATX80224.1 hypothetical protein Ga0123461_1811 [Mariprofundus aestuarium]